MSGKKRVLSGIRATGRLHLGNYLGAVKGMLSLQDNPDYETLYMIADLHTMTTPYDPEELRVNRREVVMDYLAAGLDPKRSIIFAQSDVPEHTELAFYFATVVSVARMQHLPTFKDKVKQYPKAVTMALLNYPILMAADILAYKAELVPVGVDQEPHLEIAREIARKMNQTYGTDFPEPQRFETSGGYVPSLVGEGKMSKSVSGSYITLTDDLSTIRKRLATVPTDSGKGEKVPEKGGVANLLVLVGLFMGEDRRRTCEAQYRSEGIRYQALKDELSEVIYRELEPFQRRRNLLAEDQPYVDRVLREGSEKARRIARETLDRVRGKVGLG